MNCPSCVVVALHYWCGDHGQWTVLKVKSLWPTFFKWHWFLVSLYVPVLCVWVIKKASYLTQICICTRATQTNIITQLWIKYFKSCTFFILSHARFLKLYLLVRVSYEPKFVLSVDLCYLDIIWYLNNHYFYLFTKCQMNSGPNGPIFTDLFIEITSWSALLRSL